MLSKIPNFVSLIFGNRGVTWRDPVPLLLQIHVGKNAYRTPLGLAPSKTTHDLIAAKNNLAPKLVTNEPKINA